MMREMTPLLEVREGEQAQDKVLMSEKTPGSGRVPGGAKVSGRAKRWMMRVVLTQALATALWGCDPFNATFDEVEEAQYYEAQELVASEPPGGDIVVMNWNIKFGGARVDFWFDCHGDQVLMEEEEVLGNLEG